MAEISCRTDQKKQKGDYTRRQCGKQEKIHHHQEEEDSSSFMTQDPTKMTSQNSSPPPTTEPSQQTHDHITFDEMKASLQICPPSDHKKTDTEENGRERLTRYRREIAGRVWIPDIWGQEELLKDWIDCSAFDASLVPNGIMSARAALAEQRTRTNSGGLRIENRC